MGWLNRIGPNRNHVRHLEISYLSVSQIDRIAKLLSEVPKIQTIDLGRNGLDSNPYYSRMEVTLDRFATHFQPLLRMLYQREKDWDKVVDVFIFGSCHCLQLSNEKIQCTRRTCSELSDKRLQKREEIKTAIFAHLNEPILSYHKRKAAKEKARLETIAQVSQGCHKGINP